MFLVLVVPATNGHPHFAHGHREDGGEGTMSVSPASIWGAWRLVSLSLQRQMGGQKEERNQ